MTIATVFHAARPQQRRVWTCVMCLSSFLAAESLTATAATPAADQIVSHVASASRALQSFSASRSFDDLRSALDEMDGALNLDALTPQNFVAQRRTLVRGWAQVLKTIEQSYDPNYDPNDQRNWPTLGLPDPQSISDPKARAAATAAVAANLQKVKRAGYYHDLFMMDLRAQGMLRISLDFLRKIAPDGTPSDFAALDGILQQAGVSNARRAKIDAMFYARPGP